MIRAVIDYHDIISKHSFNSYAEGPHGLDWANKPFDFRYFHNEYDEQSLIDHKKKHKRSLDTADSSTGDIDVLSLSSSHKHTAYGNPRVIHLDRDIIFDENDPKSYDDTLWRNHFDSPSIEMNMKSISNMLRNGLSISTWKKQGKSKWPLRVNPSSGNLHPTEGYIYSLDSIHGISQSPFVAHYCAMDHILEIRRENIPADETNEILTKIQPSLIKIKDDKYAKVFLIGISSVIWREAWKYGERAFRYCNHDVGHAIAAISIAAGNLGWKTMLLDDYVSSDDIRNMLGLNQLNNEEAEHEHPDCLLAIVSNNQVLNISSTDSKSTTKQKERIFLGRANRLSKETPIPWQGIEMISAICEKPTPDKVCEDKSNSIVKSENIYKYREHPSTYIKTEFIETKKKLEQIIHQRRSAVDFDGKTFISRDIFFSIMEKTISAANRVPMSAFQWDPLVHLLVFVHRVHDLEPGLYFLVRNLDHLADIKKEIKSTIALSKTSKDFLWEKPEGCPDSLPLFRLLDGDFKRVAKSLSCDQDIAGDSSFSVGMIARFEDAINEKGSWFYPRLFWETGAIGQILYLEAEAAEIRGTGIGCYFDREVHSLLGIDDFTPSHSQSSSSSSSSSMQSKKNNFKYQSLYHFTVGGPIEDTRVTNLPGYSD